MTIVGNWGSVPLETSGILHRIGASELPILLAAFRYQLLKVIAGGAPGGFTTPTQLAFQVLEDREAPQAKNGGCWPTGVS